MDKCFGFIGLGAMGTAMATLLSRHVQSFGGTLYVFNRTNCKTKAFCATNKEIVPTGAYILRKIKVDKVRSREYQSLCLSSFVSLSFL